MVDVFKFIVRLSPLAVFFISAPSFAGKKSPWGINLIGIA
jgi:hypothetical protein